jgi:molecular chaperone GrpE
MEETILNNTAQASPAQAEIERLKQEVRREHELYLHVLADVDKYRQRSERERERAVNAGKREIILPLLEVLEDFERALEHLGSTPEPVSAGLRAIHRRLKNLLQAQGLSSFGRTD